MANCLEFVRLLNTPVKGIELFEARLTKHRFGKHFHDAYTIGLNEAGLGQCMHGERQHYHYPGVFNCINPGEIHTGEAVAGKSWTLRNLYISQTVARDYLSELGYPTTHALPCFSHISVEDIPLKCLFIQLFTVLENPTSLLEQQSLLFQFFSQLFVRYTWLSKPSDRDRSETFPIATVRAYIEANCVDDFSIQCLATLVDLNPYYLIRCFREQVGTSPHQYKLHWQLQRAKQMIVQEDIAIAQIAADCGFYDQSHLSRTFKRTFGVSPGHYRKVNFVQACRWLPL